MPRKRYTKKRPRRARKTKRRRRAKKGITKYRRPDKLPAKKKPAAVVTGKGTWLPDIYICNHPYSEIPLMTGSITTPHYAKYIYNLTYPYDPNNTGAGHKAHGYDQMRLLYRTYLVEELHYDVQFYIADNAAYTSVANIIEVGMCFGPQGYGNQFPSAGAAFEMETNKYHLRKQILMRSTNGTTNTTTPVVRNGYNGKFKGKIKIADLVATYGNYDYMTHTLSGGFTYPDDYQGYTDLAGPIPGTVPQMIMFAYALPQDGETEQTILPLPWLYATVKLNYVTKWSNPYMYDISPNDQGTYTGTGSFFQQDSAFPAWITGSTGPVGSTGTVGFSGVTII